MRLRLCTLLLLLISLPLAEVCAQRRGSFRPYDPLIVKSAISSDSSTLAIARSSADIRLRRGRVELVDIKTGKSKLTINGFDGPVWGVSFSPDNQTLLTASTEMRDEKIEKSTRSSPGTIVSELKFWDARTGEFKRKVTLAGKGRFRLETSWSNDGTLALIERFISTGVESADDNMAAMLSSPLSSGWIRPSLGGSLREGVNLKLLDAQSGEVKVKLKGGSSTFEVAQAYFGRLEKPTFSPDGSMLAVLAREEVKIWNTRTGEKSQPFKDLRGQPYAVAFAPDNKSIAIASFKVENEVRESEISVWDAATGKLVKKLTGKYDFVVALQIIANSRVVLIGTLQYEPTRTIGTVKLWDLSTNRMASFNVNESESVSSLNLLPDGNTVVLHSGKNVEIWDVKSWKVRYHFEGKSGDDDTAKSSRYLLSVKSVASVAFTADDTTVLGEIPEQGIKIWDARTGGVKGQVKQESDSLIAMSSDGRSTVSVDAEALRIRNLAQDTPKAVELRDLKLVSTLAISSKDDQLALARENEITLIGGSSQLNLKGHAAPVEQLVFADTAPVLISVDEAGVLKVWDRTTGQLKSTIATGSSTTAIAVDPAALFVATANEDFLISVWDARSGALVSKMKKHEGTINALAFSPDSKLLASGGDDKVAVIWDVQSGRSKNVLKGHELTVSSLTFSHNGTTLATGSGNSAVVLWSVSNGKLDRILR